MSKKPKLATKPLTGIRVLVGRAKHQAGALSAELRKCGADVIEIPFIEIRKPKSFQPLDAALKSLGTYDWLILTSVNGVEAMWARAKILHLPWSDRKREGHGFSRAVRAREGNSAAAGGLRIAAIGPATKKAVERRGANVDVVPKEYVAESVVRSLKSKVKGKRVLLVRAKIARDVIPSELRRAGAHVDVVEAYETVVPQSSRRRLDAALKNRPPQVVTFTSSSTVRNFMDLLGSRATPDAPHAIVQECSPRTILSGIQMASIGPITSATLRELGLPVDISAREYTIPGLVEAIVSALGKDQESTTQS